VESDHSSDEGDADVENDVTSDSSDEDYEEVLNKAKKVYEELTQLTAEYTHSCLVASPWPSERPT
jgi:hypothetical protein